MEEISSHDRLVRQHIAQIQEQQNQLQAAVQKANSRQDELASLIERLNSRLESLEQRSPSVEVQFKSDAGDRIAKIPELVEIILLHLPVRDLLLAQRVSTTFKAVIDKSQPIQRALFLLPENVPSRFRETDVRINPLLVSEKSFIGIPLYRRSKSSQY
jgi:hypothetical protein